MKMLGKITARKFFPGYIMIKMLMNKESWYLVKTTPGITGFIGPGRRPTPISEEEIDEGYQCFDSEDFNEGYRAFLNKTKPDFKGQ